VISRRNVALPIQFQDLIGLDNLLGSRSPRQSLIEDIKFNDRQRVQSMLADGFRQTSDGGRRTEYPSTHDEYAASNIQRACAPVSRNPWESEASPHLSRQGSSVGAWADLKYSDAARDRISPAQNTAYMGDQGTFLIRGHAEDHHHYAPGALGARTRNRWAVGQDHEQAGGITSREAEWQRHLVVRRPPPVRKFRAEPYAEDKKRAKLSWSPLEENVLAPATECGTAHSEPSSGMWYGVEYELQSDHGASEAWQSIYTGPLESYVTAPLPPIACICFRARAISALSKPGPWVLLQLQRSQEHFYPGSKDLATPAGGFNRAATRWVWPEDEVVVPSAAWEVI